MAERKELFEILKQLAPEVQATSASKGFWDQGEKRNKGEMIMLIISELGEALDADREKRWFKYSESEHFWLNSSTVQEKDFINVFRNCVKDTVGDEIADTIIRILDYAHGWKLAIEPPYEFKKESKKNIGEDLLYLSDYVIRMYKNHMDIINDIHVFSRNTSAFTPGFVLMAIIAFCEWHSIDILSHLRWKATYNKSREKMHGKQY